VRSVALLRTALETHLGKVHARRADSIYRAVTGLVRGGKLCLTSLGRALPGATTDKHRIKAVDRLLGKQEVHAVLPRFYRAIACWLLDGITTPVIAVDWTGVGAHHCELSAKLCSDGRALPLLSLVFDRHDNASRGAHLRFLRELADVLPEGCKPILVTDAGFCDFWFNAVRSYGWDYVGRIRGSIRVTRDGTEHTLKEIHRLAGAHPRDLGVCLLGRYKGANRRRIILAKEVRLKGRKRVTRRGTEGRSGTDRTCSKGAREPWVLATSLDVRAHAVVSLYALRTQIEQAFRDRKSHRNGWSLRLVNTRSINRLAVLLLIASLAELAVQLAGRAMAKAAAARQLQANTIRHRRVFSFFFLGISAIRNDIEAGHRQLTRAMRELRATLTRNAAICAPL